MKRFHLDQVERQTLTEMGMWHSHPRVRRRAQALVRLSHGIQREQVAQEYGVHLNSLRSWIERWMSSGLVGLHEGHRAGRPGGLTPPVAERLKEVALAEGGTVRHIMACMEVQQMPLRAQPATVSLWLKSMGFRYKRYRTSLKKSVMQRR